MGVLLPWAVAAGLITVRDVKAGHPPVPSEFIAAGGAFAIFAVIGQANPQLGAVLGWALVLSIALQIGPKALTDPGAAFHNVGSTGPGGSGKKK